MLVLILFPLDPSLAGGERGATNRLDELPMLQQGRLVLNVAAGSPCLNLVAQPLQLLNLTLQIVFELFLLGLVGCLLDLVVDGLELSHAFGHLLEALVHLLR